VEDIMVEIKNSKGKKQMKDIEIETKVIIEKLKTIDNIDELINSINYIRKELHLISPFKNEPVDFVEWVKNSTVGANDYNPNSVAPPEMELLRHSISSDGYTQPIVTWSNSEVVEHEVIDGFHRHRVGKECEDIQKRIHGYLPIVAVTEDREGKNDRIASTIRHNRARGKHKVEAMAEIVLDLKKRNWSDKKIAKELGMDQDEVLRLSQITGLLEAFENSEFSEAWEAESYED
jgi:ParB-like chromosome segregation protein Spo0J